MSKMFSAWARPDKAPFPDGHDGFASLVLKWIKEMEVIREK
jgi:hypothetical protein